MTVYICMLRSINVSGKNKIAMNELRALFQSLGHENVATYIQSGNVVFASSNLPVQALTEEIEQQIASVLGLSVPAVIRSRDELGRVLERNPFIESRGRDPSRLHVTFLGQAPEPALVAATQGFEAAPDEFFVDEREVYLHCPDGYGNTKLNNAFWERRLEVTATTRNWSTVAKLAEMAAE